MTGPIATQQTHIIPVLRGLGSPGALAAPLGYLYEDASAGEVWVKFGALDTNWKRVGDVTRSIEISHAPEEGVPAFAVVTATGYRADSANPLHKNIVLGLAREALSAGVSGPVVVEGYVQNPAWTWTRGNILFLNGTSLSTTPPTTGFRVQIGEALSATEIRVKITESILL